MPLDYDYFDWEGRNYLRIIGRNEKGKRLCVIDKFNPYLWAILKKGVNEKEVKELIKVIERIKIKGTNRITKVIKTEIHDKNFLGKPVKAVKIFISNYKDAHEVADNLDFPEIEARRGYDVPLITKYIIENKLVPLRWYKIKGRLLNGSLEFGGIDKIDIDECYEAEKIEEAEDIGFQPKILAFDIEAGEFGIGKGEVLMISLVGKNFKKVLSWKKCPKKLDFVECFKDEADMIEALASAAAGVEDAVARLDDRLDGEPAPGAVEAGGHDPVHRVVHRRDAVEHAAHAVGRERARLVGHHPATSRWVGAGVVTSPTGARASSPPRSGRAHARPRSRRGRRSSRRHGRSRARRRGSPRRLRSASRGPAGGSRRAASRAAPARACAAP